jgi:hypothetical protein
MDKRNAGIFPRGPLPIGLTPDEIPPTVPARRAQRARSLADSVAGG